MKKGLLVLGGLILFGLGLTWFAWSRMPPAPAPVSEVATPEEYFTSTESETDERVRDLGLDKPSENVSYFLDSTKLKLPTQPEIGRVEKGHENDTSLVEEFNVYEYIVLAADTAYKGADAWDALSCLHLRWGDGDVFHWRNKSGFGDDSYFSVWTNTNPGYFLPEDIVAGNMHPKDLVFGYSVPRNPDPEHMYDVMMECAKYCQKRLGGKFVTPAGKPLDEEHDRKELKELVQKMRSKGIVPGSDKALMIY